MLARTGARTVRRCEAMRTGHDRVLPGLVQAVLQEAGIGMADIDEIIVATGPGSFTGSRIGVAFARGLGVALGVPVKGVNLLHALARQIAKQDRGLAVRNVGRGQLGWCAVRDNEVILPPDSGSEADLQTALAAFADPSWNEFLANETPIETDLDVLAETGHGLSMDAAPADPWYARPPDAKLPGGVDPWA